MYREMDFLKIKDNLSKIIDIEKIKNIRKTLHSYPEISFQENTTSEFIINNLKNWGFTNINIIGGTGVVAVLNGNSNCNSEIASIGLRADIDALPMNELTNLDYKSKNKGCMHACGHDGHTAILLGVAWYMSENIDNFKGTINFIFQPAEESGAGAKKMIDDGLFQKFPCDEIYALHNWPEFEKGKIISINNTIMAGDDDFFIEIIGKGGHAALPHLTIDPIYIGSQIINSLQSIVSRNISPLNSAVISVTTFNGGTTTNVIPDNANISGTFRYINIEDRIDIQNKITFLSESIAKSFNAIVKVNFENGYPPTINSLEQSTVSQKVAKIVVGEENVITNCNPSMGTEDFSFMLQEIPGCYIWLGSKDCEHNVSLHNSMFDFNDNILKTGILYFILIIYSRLSQFT